MSEALANAQDAFAAVMDIHEDRRHPLPSSICIDDANGPLSVEALVAIP